MSTPTLRTINEESQEYCFLLFLYFNIIYNNVSIRAIYILSGFKLHIFSFFWIMKLIENENVRQEITGMFLT